MFYHKWKMLDKTHKISYLTKKGVNILYLLPVEENELSGKRELFKGKKNEEG